MGKERVAAKFGKEVELIHWDETDVIIGLYGIPKSGIWERHNSFL